MRMGGYGARNFCATDSSTAAHVSTMKVVAPAAASQPHLELVVAAAAALAACLRGLWQCVGRDILNSTRQPAVKDAQQVLLVLRHHHSALVMLVDERSPKLLISLTCSTQHAYTGTETCQQENKKSVQPTA